MPEIKKYKYLEVGDLKKVAKELGVKYQKVKEVSCGRVNSYLISETLAELNEKRKQQAETLKVEAVQNIINQNQ